MFELIFWVMIMDSTFEFNWAGYDRWVLEFEGKFVSLFQDQRWHLYFTLFAMEYWKHVAYERYSRSMIAKSISSCVFFFVFILCYVFLLFIAFIFLESILRFLFNWEWVVIQACMKKILKVSFQFIRRNRKSSKN